MKSEARIPKQRGEAFFVIRVLIAVMSISAAARFAGAGGLSVTEKLLHKLPAGVALSEVVVSPDGNRFAYVKRTPFKLIPVIDGVEQKGYDWISLNQVAFTADSRHCVYQVKQYR